MVALSPAQKLFIVISQDDPPEHGDPQTSALFRPGGGCGYPAMFRSVSAAILTPLLKKELRPRFRGFGWTPARRRGKTFLLGSWGRPTTIAFGCQVASMALR